MKKTNLSLFAKIQEQIKSDALKEAFRINPKNFTRNRKMPFDKVVLFMLNLARKSLQLELISFLKLFGRGSTVSNSAYNQNRMKIKPELFKHISEELNKEFYSDNEERIKLWRGFRVLATDGSLITMPITDELKKKYGVTRNQHSTELVMGRCSILYDLINKMVINGELAAKSTGERILAIKHLEYCSSSDLIIYDRGYPSFEFIDHHNKKGINFIIRCKLSFSNDVESFVKSEKTSSIIKLKPGKNTDIKGKGFSRKDFIEVRLIKVVLDSGETEVLITSLIDESLYPTEIFKELYFKRWGIETYYDQLKNVIQVEKFTGYTDLLIQQDFYCALLMSNIQSLLINELEEQVIDLYKGRKYEYKINTNLSFGLMKDRMVDILINEKPENLVEELKGLLLANVVPIRPGRKNKREVGKFRNRQKPIFLKNHKNAL
ncbi:MAG TPA: IS4 family transposase [Cytophagales bacterium]|nr:IS4 family transposase [Cytophagales bacterium]